MLLSENHDLSRWFNPKMIKATTSAAGVGQMLTGHSLHWAKR